MAQKEKSIIRSLLDPTIVLDTLKFNDIDTGTSTQDKENKTEGQKKFEQTHKDLGTNYPLVSINNYVFNPNEILDFKIDANGFIPKLYVKVTVKGKNFGSQAIPKDGDLVNVFIRAKSDVFKPIRNDYRITNIQQSGANDEGMYSMFIIEGELNIPTLYDEVIKSYSGTSYEVLKEISKELKLGFASNDTATNDAQTWINPGGDLAKMIVDVSDHAWKDESSFFTVFIDVYYHINFINVNSQFSESKEVDLALVTDMLQSDTQETASTKETSTSDENSNNGAGQTPGRTGTAKSTYPKVLTNWRDLRGTNMYIHSFNVKNQSNAVNEEFGYKTYNQFFEQNSEKYWSIYAEPLTTPGSETEKIILKGRTTKPGAPKEEFWKTQNRYVWQGIQYSAPEGNCHEKYTYAKIWNDRNLAELGKMYIAIDLERANFNFYRGERVPVLIIAAADTQYQISAAPPEDPQQLPAGKPKPILDKFYSGYYVLSGMVFNYKRESKYQTSDGITDDKEKGKGPGSSPGFYQEIYLTRREWPTPI